MTDLKKAIKAQRTVRSYAQPEARQVTDQEHALSLAALIQAHAQLLHEAHGGAAEDRSYAGGLPFDAKRAVRRAGLAIATQAAESYAVNRATNSRNPRTRVRARAAMHIREHLARHTSRAALATLTPIATARVGLSYALDHKRGRLKGVGLAGSGNAFNASHYLKHHGAVVDRLAREHRVSRSTAAHALAYTATALHAPAPLRGRQTATGNHAYHAEMGRAATKYLTNWRNS